MSRLACTSVIALVALSLAVGGPASGRSFAADAGGVLGTARVPVPSAGSVELSTFAIRLKGRKLPSTLSLQLVNAKELASAVVVLGGVRLIGTTQSGKDKIGTYEVETAGLHR